jgi:hypothetical protein
MLYGHANLGAWNLRPLRHTRFALIANSSGELRVSLRRSFVTQLQNSFNELIEDL